MFTVRSWRQLGLGLAAIAVIAPRTVLADSGSVATPAVNLADADTPSVSLGDSARGELLGGVELPRRAPGLWRLSVVAARDSGWGTRSLVEVILRVAAQLQSLPEHEGVPLRVGNLSLRRGGEMRWSHSHRSGRDADVLLYLVDDIDGTPVAPDEFLVLNANGRGTLGRGRHARAVRFDAPRLWHVVSALLQDGHVQVQHLYLAEPLRRAVLAHARTVGTQEWLLQRAQLVLTEPGHSGRHDDHLHVRLYCSHDDRLAGCDDDGPRWPWVQDYDHEVRRRVEELLGELGDPDADRRVRAIDRLTWFQHSDRRAIDALIWAAANEPPALAERAINALVRAAEPAAFPALLRAAVQAVAATTVNTLLDAALQVATADDAPAILALLAPDCGDAGERLGQAARSALRARVARTVRPWLLEASAAPLVALLDDADTGTRRAALRSLEFLANRRFANEDVAMRWYERDADRGRWRWLMEGFAAQGLPMRATPSVLVPRLLTLLAGADEIAAANAEALLLRLLGAGPVERVSTNQMRHRSWSRWWDVNRQRYADGEAESATPGTKSGGTNRGPASGQP